MAETTDNAKTVTITVDATGEKVTLPVLEGTIGPDVVDIRKFYGQTDMFTLILATALQAPVFPA